MSSDDAGKSEPKEPEILPPEQEGEPSDGGRPAIYADIVAQFNRYTDRPDLFLEAIEKHDPGFIKRMNSEAERFSKKHRDSRFRFGRNQAYTALVVGALAAICLLAAVFYLIYTKQAGIGTFIGIAILYAVTQGGASGFASLIEGVRKAIDRWKNRDHPNNEPD